jgi:hypothetical protein
MCHADDGLGIAGLAVVDQEIRASVAEAVFVPERLAAKPVVLLRCLQDLLTSE